MNGSWPGAVSLGSMGVWPVRHVGSLGLWPVRYHMSNRGRFARTTCAGSK